MKSEIDIIEAHKHSIYHREEVMQSELCGCFYCLEIFPPSKITEWIDEIEGVNIHDLEGYWVL